jgi:VWFA-related protein
MSCTRTLLSNITSACLALALAVPLPAQTQEAPAAAKKGHTLYATTELVLVNVIARDKKGNLVRNLKKDDFTVYEDGEKQHVSSFDFENVDALALAGPAEATVSGAAEAPSLLASKNQPKINARDRRLILLFFDFTAMDPEQIDRAVDAAKTFVQTKMDPADLIAIVSLSTDLVVDLDFTDDRTKVLSVLSAFASSEGQGFENGSEGSAEGAAETGGSFTADDTDYNTFSADRKILALESIMGVLGKIPQKKSLIYFSNGITQSGVDNQSALRVATASAVKANVSIYPLDVRGLQAFPPGGEAQSASLHGQSAYSGAAVLNDFSSNAASQDTLSTLASDTGGKAFFDTNDFSGVFRQVQKDTSAYYVLGYTSTNHLKDGRFRRIRVKINRPDIKLEYRAGYYADRDFQHLQKADREQQLEDELASELPQTDVAVYAGTAFFRKDDSHYYLAVSLVVPGSQIPFVTEKDKDNAMIDIIGEVLEDGKLPVGRLRDTVKLAVDSSEHVRRKNVEYNTGFLLAPGKYHLKFIVRENRTGRMGSFETDVQIPDLRKVPLRMSSVVLSSKRVPVSSRKRTFNPLLSDGEELVPSVTHVFTQDQHLYLQFEVYDPAKEKKTEVRNKQGKEQHEQGAVRVLTSIELLKGDRKVYESKPVLARELTAPDRKAVGFRFDLPLESLKPGFYTCQVNVIDDASGNFAFPRWPILVKSASPKPVEQTPSATGRGAGSGK